MTDVVTGELVLLAGNPHLQSEVVSVSAFPRSLPGLYRLVNLEEAVGEIV